MRRWFGREFHVIATALVVGLLAGNGAHAADIPDDIRARGVLRVGSQLTLPPIEFREDGKQEIIGISADLLAEVTKRLGLKLEFLKGEYAALIPGLEAGRFDMTSGGMSDTEEREEKVDFVNYLLTGGSVLVKKRNVEKYKSLADFCGKKVALLLGARTFLATVEGESKGCVGRGARPIEVMMLPTAPDARMQLDLERVDGYVTGFDALGYMVKKDSTNIAIVGGNYVHTPYVSSWAFPKSGTRLRDAVQKAAQSMVDDGTYTAILTKWGLEGGHIGKVTVNLPSSKR